ncbi:trihelix transcription factor PTL-like [Telopea speciosissima]|uniref:trihelix transcription factor PTL-like n=1 Tax=Telopea speciosissima TaxID=54955 RepID=UPI001CC4EF83|nr:trihelix transcription factor PTL-like [Telopea speciosissima]
MEMGEQYGVPDLRQLMGGRTLFPAVPQAAEALPSNRDLRTDQHYEMMMMMGGRGRGRQVVGESMLPLAVVDFHSDHHHHHHSTSPSTTTAAPEPPPSASAISGFEKETSCIGGDSIGNGRWPRQETLTLLEIRSLLDPKFKEANQKGPLWDEVSRIMAEEHGYQRSGKKCREKFENLYKYYKKTKESKAGRQDGKHYRFFRQLEALYGERERDRERDTTNTSPPSPSPSNSNVVARTTSTPGVHDSCFRYLMNEEEPLWENYDVKLNKGHNS